MQPTRLKLGLILAPLFAFVLSGLTLLTAAPRHGAKTAVTKAKKASPAKHPTKAASKAPAKGAAKGATKGHSAKSSATAKAPAKGSSRATGKRSAKGAVKGRKGSAHESAKRSGPAVYRQMSPDPDRIRQIQQALTERGYNVDVSGAWDSSTVSALQKFQIDQKIENLSGKGKLDSMTLIALGLGPKREPPSGRSEEPKQTPEGR